MGAYQRLVRSFGKTKVFAHIMKRVAPPLDRVVSKMTKGRTVAGSVLPTFILVHIGRKSGREIRTPLSFVRVGDGYAIAGSNFGQAHHPAWSANLLAHPDAFVEVDGQRVPVRARRVSEEEKKTLWPRFVDMWPAYDVYDERSGERNIRVFVLEKR